MWFSDVFKVKTEKLLDYFYFFMVYYKRKGAIL
jgi:hypothetical protein